ncbi:hypothetical protein FOXG_16333 [Fusarium oxysporum f. sp. lycopersici 4287]|nr:uncharacterized protein FOXG_16333 [Fusarium oxysporum f. sp. lycopersici 4287]KNB18931.1 hypothetical protein FOXG_16333 [Fusarium oxysporum f. sp. lycopersici 4287]
MSGPLTPPEEASNPSNQQPPSKDISLHVPDVQLQLRSALRKSKNRKRRGTAPSNPEHTRESHNLVEKHYRARLKTQFERLLTVLQWHRRAALRNCFNKQAYIEAVEHSELRDLALACNPAIGDLLINGRKQAMGYINSNYSLYSSQLAERLQTTQSKIHISSNLWTSPQRHGVPSVCVQWVYEDFKLQKALLGLPECKYSHSGTTQAELITRMLRKFNITAQNLGYYIDDNATPI